MDVSVSANSFKLGFKEEENLKDGMRGKWEKIYRGKRKDVITGKKIDTYYCTCSVCGWETGNQGTRFNYCPNCGAKMEQ